jgi:hypothetical protein
MENPPVTCAKRFALEMTRFEEDSFVSLRLLVRTPKLPVKLTFLSNKFNPVYRAL